MKSVQHIVGNSIKHFILVVMELVYVIRFKAKRFHVFNNFIFCCFPFCQYVRLCEHCTELLAAVIREANHLIGYITKELIVCVNANEEVLQIIPSIFKVVQFDNRRFTVMEHSFSPPLSM